ncbi:MAG: hypothetical protein NC924_04170, partial [Candidatus Omnitrophica bacterium]|nr:hypothetical protein [Candidatus Omnitrophota bacterium]
MTMKELKEMISLMKDNNISELELERAGLKIKLRRGIGGSPIPNMYIERVAPEYQTVVAPAVAPAQPPPAAVNKNIVEVKSPMVGT